MKSALGAVSRVLDRHGRQIPCSMAWRVREKRRNQGLSNRSRELVEAPGQVAGPAGTIAKKRDAQPSVGLGERCRPAPSNSTRR
jgi:hypothetical protein